MFNRSTTPPLSRIDFIQFNASRSSKINSDLADLSPTSLEKIELWDPLKQILAVHRGYAHHPSNFNGTSLTLKALSLSIFIALGSLVTHQVSYAFPSESAFTYNVTKGEWSLGDDSGFIVKTKSKPIYTLLANGEADPFDNSEAWLWSSSSSSVAPSSLSLVISKDQSWNHTAANEYIDGTSRTIWVSGGLISDFAAADANIINGLSAAPSVGNYSKTTDGNSLLLTLEENITFMGKFFGSRNDIGGGTGATISMPTVGQTNENAVTINLKKGSKLYAKLIYGGRSAQLDGSNGAEKTFSVNVENVLKKVTTTVIHTGFEANDNKVYIQGTLAGTDEEIAQGVVLQARDFVANTPKNSALLITKGIFGSEGYDSSNNLLSVKDSLIVAGMPKARKLGLVGGRGVYFMRINQIEKDDAGALNNSLVWNNGKLADHSAIANHNIVTIDNSYIGFKVLKSDNDWDDFSETKKPTLDNPNEGWAGTNHAVSIFGGWSTGEAANNIVSINNSVINGNVIGALELQDRLYADKTNLRDLNPNLVSLFNVKLEKGSSIYGTSTAKGNFETNKGVDRVNETSLQVINRRRGVVYFSGENEADSVFARYVHFGQYVDNSELEKKPETERNIFRDYYPTSPNYDKVLNDPSYEIKDSDALKRITSSSGFASQYKMQLGDLVARSYVINKTGFHSSLATQDSVNVSDVTNGLHNFWVGAYFNLVNSVEGDGAIFNKDNQDLFEDKKNFTVNHNYGGGTTSRDQNLSLLVHDDGMIYAFDKETPHENNIDNLDSNQSHRPALMHNFRYHYDGLVLYSGVNTGIDGYDKDGKPNKIHAVEISFGKIQEFRKNQDLNAFGNTFVGVFLEGNAHPFFKPSSVNGFNSISFEEMTFEPETVDGLPPFEIKQGGEIVAKATYGFYKYLHFDGTDGKFDVYADNNGTKVKIDSGLTGKLTPLGESGGIGLKYWLRSLDIVDGKTLMLNGATSNTDLGSTSSIRLQERFTLSAALSGKGNVAIAENSTVVLGSPKTIYTIASLNEAGDDVIYKKPEANEYTGYTDVQEGATLAAGIDGALGSTSKFTSSLHLQDNSAFYLQKHTQDVGHLFVAEKAKLDLSNAPELSEIKKTNSTDAKTFTYVADMGRTGELVVHNTYKPHGENLASNIFGNIVGDESSKLVIDSGRVNISSANEYFIGTFELRRAEGYLYNSNALQKAKAVVSQGSSLYFYNASELAIARSVDPRSNAYVGAIQNAGQVFLSGGKDEVAALNHVNVENGYAGQNGSVIHFRGLVQGPDNSYVDVVHSETATGTSQVSFGDDHSKIPVSGIFKEARGEKTLKSVGIPVFVIANREGGEGSPLELKMQPFGVVAKDNEAYKWIYSLGYNDEEQQRTWVLYNSDDKDHYEPLVPPKEEENLVLRPEAGAYVGASQSWAKMHMRLHDRFGQAYYIDPFDGEEKPAAAWVRQVGSHSHFRMAGGQSKTHSNTAVTQIGGDLLRNEFNEDWKYIGGVFAGGLYNRSDSRSWDSAKSRSDGYSLGIYGTLYTGNSPDDGFYVDSWLLFGRYDNKIWSDEISPFKFKSHGWVWSVETGYTIPIGESGTKDYNKLIWTFQPEAQLVWDGVKANSVNDSFGTKYRQLGTDNVTLRVGARLHANYMNKGLGFIEGNWIHNSKKAGVQMGTDKVYMDGGRNLGEFRMGLEGHLSRNTLGWATVGVQAGKSGYHNETAQIGIKYMF